LWRVECQTPVGIDEEHFYGTFKREEADLAIFYGIIESVRWMEGTGPRI